MRKLDASSIASLVATAIALGGAQQTLVRRIPHCWKKAGRSVNLLRQRD